MRNVEQRRRPIAPVYTYQLPLLEVWQRYGRPGQFREEPELFQLAERRKAKAYQQDCLLLEGDDDDE